MDVRPTVHDHIYYVASETGEGEYQVICIKDQWVCTCKAFQKKKLPCKHIGRLFEYFTEREGGSADDHEVIAVNGIVKGVIPPHHAHGNGITPYTAENSPNGTASPISKWVKQIHGKDFIQYCGLLAMAHEQGLISLSASFVSVTSELAIAVAFAVFKDGRKFFEAADSTPINVHAQVKGHFPRVALTRAKARVLRDALNIGMVAVEELEDH